MQVTVNENIKYSLWDKISIEAVISKATDAGVLPENIRGLKFEGYNIEIPWGPFWKKCVNFGHFPAEISVIGESMYRNCINHGKVFLTDNLTKIKNSAFENCKKITETMVA